MVPKLRNICRFLHSRGIVAVFADGNSSRMPGHVKRTATGSKTGASHFEGIVRAVQRDDEIRQRPKALMPLILPHC